MPADGGIKFGPYILLRRIARGGMAEVFLAQQRGLEGFDRRVAVKRILPHLADGAEFVKMFLGEARFASQLTHPNIVHIYDFGKVDNDYFIAMEFVDGVHAGRFRQARMPPTLVARLGADAANALHHAHELTGANGKSIGLVHRDVSPANIMVSYDGIVKLCDFGIAKAAAVNLQLTSPGQLKGKYAYMSPEQVVGGSLDGRSDVFTLGICLWEMLVGETFVPHSDPVEAMRMIRDGKVPAVGQVAPATPPQLAKIVSWALETNRENRATAAELAQALEAFIKSSPELATSTQLADWVRTRFPHESSSTNAVVHRILVEAVSPSTMDALETVGGDLGVGEVSIVTEPNPLSPVTPPPELIGVGSTKQSGFDSDDPDQATLSDSKLLDRSTFTERSPNDDDEPTYKPFGSGPRGWSPPAPAQTPPLAHEPMDLNKTVEWSGARRMPVAIPPLAIAPPLFVAPPIVADPAARRPPRKVVIALIGMAITLVIVIIALPSGDKPAAIATRDAGAEVVAVVPIDAPLAVPIDMAPAISLDASQASVPQPLALLEVHTKPEGALVSTGGQRHTAPAQFSLPAGRHVIIAEFPGWENEQREVDLLAAGYLDQEIVFATRSSKQTQRTGKLTLRTTPTSEVFNDKVKIGDAPFADLVLPAGTYTLTFKHPTRPTTTRNVTIFAGKITKLSFTLPQ